MHRFEELQAFVSVVEAGSFTAAADRLELRPCLNGLLRARMAAPVS